MSILLRTESRGEVCPEDFHSFGELTKTKDNVTLGFGKVGGKVPGRMPTCWSHLGKLKDRVQGLPWQSSD